MAERMADRIANRVGGIRQFRSIQTLRALAALGVVAFHAEGNVATYGWATHFFHQISRFGEIGVDVFFVISGFVMVLVTHGKPPGVASAKAFIVARIARVVPLYWALTSLFIVLLLVVPGAFGNASLNVGHAVASYLFFPWLNWIHVTAPVVGVGWTLNYEMWFYSVFAVSMCLTRYRLLAVAAFLAVMSALHFVDPGGVAFSFYTNPIVMEFVFGTLVGWVYATGRAVPIAVAAAIVVSILAAGKVFAPALTETNRFLVFGLPAFAVVVAGLSLENKLRWSALLELVGDSSYSLYLTHVFSVPVCVKLLQIFDRQHRMPGDLVCVVVVLASVAVGLASYQWLEGPMNRMGKRLIGRTRATAEPARN
ncbi:acyltransferase family protein [Paraburkholderia caledonica]|uniref:acyltransferase family protein n=1 Tax=Paraburkholderia caledonica TaxID=134536 RepID=UPI000B3F75BB|nr:acyltransferase [Paraburkholderia caledonica]